MRSVNALLVVAVMTFTLAGVGSAAPIVSMVWTDCEGAGCGAGIGTSSIIAAPGDLLTLDILVTPDDNGVSFASLSYDVSAAGVASVFYRFGIDSINDGFGHVFTDIGASAMYTGDGLTYMAGSGVICPGPPAVGNESTGLCGQLTTGHLAALSTYTPGDLGGGIIGSFPAGPSLTTESQFTLATAQFGVTSAPEPPPDDPEPPPDDPEPPPIVPELPPDDPEPPPAIPEPSSTILFLSGLVLVCWRLRRA